jgi:hypothetical protein
MITTLCKSIHNFVIPAQAGIPLGTSVFAGQKSGAPAFAGVTRVFEWVKRLAGSMAAQVSATLNAVIPAQAGIPLDRQMFAPEKSGAPACAGVTGVRERVLFFDKRRVDVDAVMQIKPVGIHGFDYSYLPRSIPFLHLLFAPDGFFHRGVMFIPNKIFQTVILGETVKRFVLVISNAAPERTRHTNIYRAPVSIGHDVNSRIFLFMHRLINANLARRVNDIAAVTS